jgi:hypothetical protein
MITCAVVILLLGLGEVDRFLFKHILLTFDFWWLFLSFACFMGLLCQAITRIYLDMVTWSTTYSFFIVGSYMLWAFITIMSMALVIAIDAVPFLIPSVKLFFLSMIIVIVVLFRISVFVMDILPVHTVCIPGYMDCTTNVSLVKSLVFSITAFLVKYIVRMIRFPGSFIMINNRLRVSLV